MVGAVLISFGTVIAIIVLCIIMMVFLPSNKNFYKSSVFDDSSSKSTIDRLCTILIGGMDDRFVKKKLQRFVSDIESHQWCPYPGDSWMTADKNQVFKYIPFVPNDITGLEKGILEIAGWDSKDMISSSKGVVLSGLLKIDENSIMNPHKTWRTLGNATLRCLIPLKSPSSDIDDCGVWVDNDIRRIKFGEMIIFDHSKMWSLYNKEEDSSCIFLFIDISRPWAAHLGSSEVPDLEVDN